MFERNGKFKFPVIDLFSDILQAGGDVLQVLPGNDIVIRQHRRVSERPCDILLYMRQSKEMDALKSCADFSSAFVKRPPHIVSLICCSFPSSEREW